MGYLITKDFSRIIQTSELNAITSNDASIRQLCEGSSQAEINQYLIQRFDTSKEFSDTAAWSFSQIYKAADRIYLDAPIYSATSTYLINALTLYNGQVYISKQAITPAEAFNTSHWTLLGSQYDIFFTSYPQLPFNQETLYKKGNKVFYKDSVYTAQRDSVGLDQQQGLQSPDIQSIKFGNVLPDDPDNGALMWGTGIAYSIAAGTLPTDTSKWTKGDNRNQRMVELFLDVVIYKLCKRIAPNNVPEARHNAWLRAMEDLKNYAKGNLNANLPLIVPKTGNRVRFGGKPFKEFDVF